MKRAAWVACVISLAACSRAAQPPAPAAAGKVPAVVAAEVDGIRLVASSALPAAPRHAAQADCDAPVLSSVWRGAQAAHAQGWDVVRDIPLGRFRAVLVADGFEFMAGVGCEARGASVLVFDGPKLQGIAYSKREVFTDIEPVDDRNVRLVDITSPHADLTARGDGVLLAPLPSQDLRCNGRARVPRVENMPYGEARPELLAVGWRPLAGSGGDDGDTGVTAARRGGFAEVESCAGTGLGQCLMQLTNAVGDRLDVVTLDGVPADEDGDGRIEPRETPRVASAHVACQAASTNAP